MKQQDFTRYPATGLDGGLGSSGTFYTAPLGKTGALGRRVPHNTVATSSELVGRAFCPQPGFQPALAA